MRTFRVPLKDAQHPSKDIDSLKSSVARLNQWRRDNPGDLAEYRRYANQLGYDWENGSVDKHSYYTSYFQALNTENPSEGLTAPPATPQATATNERPWVEFSQPEEASSSEEEYMAPRNPEGRFIAMKRQQKNKIPTGQGRGTRSQTTPSGPSSSRIGSSRKRAIVVPDEQLPYLLAGSVGNTTWKDGDVAANAAGVAYIAAAAMNALRHVVQNEGTIKGRDLEIVRKWWNISVMKTWNNFESSLETSCGEKLRLEAFGIGGWKDNGSRQEGEGKAVPRITADSCTREHCRSFK